MGTGTFSSQDWDTFSISNQIKSNPITHHGRNF
ncbi:MAG: hypothetical protein JWM09_941 [Francisellaceae bacterium]|nr:hypothetical protein [Francisellaceae bacterium]